MLIDACLKISSRSLARLASGGVLGFAPHQRRHRALATEYERTVALIITQKLIKDVQ